MFEEIFEPEFDVDCQDEIVCPYCGHKHSDSWEMAPRESDDGEASCSCCGKEFCFTVNKSIDYSSHCMPGEHEMIATPSEKYPTLSRCKRCGHYEFGKPKND